jgi:uncharacterized membrane protein required for colicin V production
MKLGDIPFGALDLLTAAVLIVGIMRGRKRGLSEELLPTLQWIAIVVVGGLFYEALARILSSTQVLSPAFYNLGSYVLIAMVVRLFFSMLKRLFGEKIVGSDLFGRFEYYFGMGAGAVRYACIYLFLLSFLHAPYYTAEMLAADAKTQESNFGDIRFPTVGSLQKSFFKDSASGWAADKFIASILVQPSAGVPSDLRNDNSLAKRREHDIDGLMLRR